MADHDIIAEAPLQIEWKERTAVLLVEGGSVTGM